MRINIVNVIFILSTLVDMYNCKRLKMIMIDRLEVCALPPKSPFTVDDIILTTKNHCTSFSTSFNITRVVNSLKVLLKVKRCRNREQLDSCMDFGKFPIDNSCLFLADKTSLTANFYTAVKPPLHCPLEIGHYVVKNATFDPNMAQIFPLGNWYWKIMLEEYNRETNELHYRICTEGQVVPYYS